VRKAETKKKKGENVHLKNVTLQDVFFLKTSCPLTISLLKSFIPTRFHPLTRFDLRTHEGITISSSENVQPPHVLPIMVFFLKKCLLS